MFTESQKINVEKNDKDHFCETDQFEMSYLNISLRKAMKSQLLKLQNAKDKV